MCEEVPFPAVVVVVVAGTEGGDPGGGGGGIVVVVVHGSGQNLVSITWGYICRGSGWCQRLKEPPLGKAWHGGGGRKVAAGWRGQRKKGVDGTSGGGATRSRWRRWCPLRRIREAKADARRRARARMTHDCWGRRGGS
jgi:hypothetical protein